MSADSPRLRLGILGIVVVSLFATLFARLWFLQVMAAPTFQVAAESNRVRIVQETPVRGRILDRNGTIIVGNRQSAVVTVDREAIAEPGDREALFASLAPVLGKAPEDLEARYQDGRYNALLPLPLAEDVPEGTVVYLDERQDQLPGVSTELVAVRDYPYGALAAHVLGYVGEINESELEALASDGYELGDQLGKTGVEKTYEQDLRGTPGVTKLEVDSQGRVLRVLARRPPQPGHDVVLSIDLNVQSYTEQVLAEELANARTRRPRTSDVNYAAPAGSMVVLDPRDGAVIALASYPSYDPRVFVNGISQGQFDFLNDPANHYPLNNRATQGLYSPGSTFKLITAVAALRSGLIDARTSIVDDGEYEVPDCTDQCIFRDSGGGVDGTVDIRRAMAVSSDVFFYKLGADFWMARGRLGLGIQETARDLGLGAESGIPLPDEQAGRVPDPETKQALHEENPEAFPFGEWFTGDNVNLSIGQGDMLLTPLQLANTYATFANGGTLHSPNIALRVQEPDGAVVREFGPRALRQVALPPEVRDPILEGLREAISTEEGTAYGPFAGFPLAEFPLAGKTGTAQTRANEDVFDTSLFVGFGPVFNPEYVVAAVLEEAGFGSTAAAPAVRRVFDGLAGLAPFPTASEAPLFGAPAPAATPPAEQAPGVIVDASD
ncbi:MAG: penicillin-binding protein 2 [Acidimicrobiales bacterium]|nr:penicillin-binding protein 2 [Acidimicrobiales bacterium]